MDNLPVGTIVRIKMPILGNRIGALGVCIENYTIGKDHKGASFIFENGYHDGFSVNEQNFMLRKVGFDQRLSAYQFKSAVWLAVDYNANIFDFERLGKEAAQ